MTTPTQDKLWHEKADRLKKCVDYSVQVADLMYFRARLSDHLKAESSLDVQVDKPIP